MTRNNTSFGPFGMERRIKQSKVVPLMKKGGAVIAICFVASFGILKYVNSVNSSSEKNKEYQKVPEQTKDSLIHLLDIVNPISSEAIK